MDIPLAFTMELILFGQSDENSISIGSGSSVMGGSSEEVAFFFTDLTGQN